jgi:hypothetical protein
VEIDGQSQSEIFGVFGVGRTARCTISTWFTNESIDFAEAWHDGYRRLPTPVIHRRSVLFVKEPPSYWIIIDSLEGEGKHTLDLLFHLTAGAGVWQGEAGKVIVHQKHRASAEIRSLMSPPDAPVVIVGRVKPKIQGWVSPTTGTRQKAPVLSFKKRATLPYTFATLVRPENSTSTIFKVDHLSLSERRDGLKLSWRLQWPDTSDLVSLSRPATGDRSGNGCLTASVERFLAGAPIWCEETGSREMSECQGANLIV